MVNHRVIAHPIRLMGELFACIGMMLGLPGNIDSLPWHPRVELVAQIWSQVRMVSFRRPGPAPDFTSHLQTVTAHSRGNHRVGITRIEKLLNVDSVGQCQNLVAFG